MEIDDIMRQIREDEESLERFGKDDEWYEEEEDDGNASD